MKLTTYKKEIAPKGKAYLMLESGPAEGLPERLAALREQGARQVFLASKDPENPLCEGAWQGVHLTHVHDMLGMTRALDNHRPRPQGRLTWEPLCREKKDLFLALYNDSFFHVPNSSTYGDRDFEQIMGPEYRCGFALLDGELVGIYELGFKKETPEIGSIGLAAGARGRGLGRELLLLVMDLLAQWGHSACWLQVSTANRVALPLYESVGFVQTELNSRWYEVTKLHG